MKKLALALLLALAPLAGFAASEEHADHTKDLIFEWVNLLILGGVLVYFARKPVQDYLGSRRDTIAKNIATSEQLLRDAEAKLAEWNTKAARLDADIVEIIEATRKGAQVEKAAILADAEATASRIRQSASGVVERELRAARESLRKEAAELAVTLAGTILREQTTDADRSRLVDEFIAKVESGPGAGGAH
ncbi:MAG: ATP synthase F0 subunit B [Deltaproteobacteria bacterium]|nr:ATP synthase F0 subunit B [Deltaproteobacteria bacterium]